MRGLKKKNTKKDWKYLIYSILSKIIAFAKGKNTDEKLYYSTKIYEMKQKFLYVNSISLDDVWEI